MPALPANIKAFIGLCLMTSSHTPDNLGMRITLQNRIVEFAAAAHGAHVSIPQLVEAFPDVNPLMMANALTEMSRMGRIFVRGATVSFLAERRAGWAAEDRARRGREG
jgi:hypothetical protein